MTKSFKRPLGITIIAVFFLLITILSLPTIILPIINFATFYSLWKLKKYALEFAVVALILNLFAFYFIIPLYFTTYTFAPSQPITLERVRLQACNEWKNEGQLDAVAIKISNYDANQNGIIDPGTTCPNDNLETLGQNYYATGNCSVGIGSNEQMLANICNKVSLPFLSPEFIVFFLLSLPVIITSVILYYLWTKRKLF